METEKSQAQVPRHNPSFLTPSQMTKVKFMVFVLLTLLSVATFLLTQNADIQAIEVRLVRMEKDLARFEEAWLDIQMRLTRIETALIYIQRQLPAPIDSQ